MPQISPSSVVSKEAVLADSVVIGPNCVVRGQVTLGEGVELVANVFINGPVKIGARTRVYPGACIGFEPQDAKYKPGMPTAGVLIGSDCLIREHATLHAASKLERPTTVGDRCFIMVSSHIGHDARIGNDVVLVNNTALAGHCELEDQVIMGGNAVLHQFNRIGRMAFISGLSALSSDVPPFCLAAGRNGLAGLNIIGMRRSGMPREQIQVVRQAFREALIPNLPRQEQLAILRGIGASCPPVMEIATFIEGCKRTITPFRSQARMADESPED